MARRFQIAHYRAEAPDEFGSDMSWRWRAVGQRSAKAVRHGPDGWLVWHSRSAGFKVLVLSRCPLERSLRRTRTRETRKGRGATLGDEFIQGAYHPEAFAMV